MNQEMDAYKNVESLLPSVEQIYERSKEWSALLENYSTKCDDISKATCIDNAFECDNDGSENSRESVEVTDFEDDLEDDDEEFNVDEVLEQTMAVVEARKKRWEESGFDLDLDCCDVTEVRDKVGHWLANNQTSVSECGLNFRDKQVKVHKSTTYNKVIRTTTIKTLRITETKDTRNDTFIQSDDQPKHAHRLKRSMSGDYVNSSKINRERWRLDKLMDRKYLSSPTHQCYNKCKDVKLKCKTYTENRKNNRYRTVESSSDFVSSSSSNESNSPRKYEKRRYRGKHKSTKKTVSFHPESVINSTEVSMPFVMQMTSTSSFMETKPKLLKMDTAETDNLLRMPVQTNVLCDITSNQVIYISDSNSENSEMNSQSVQINKFRCTSNLITNKENECQLKDQKDDKDTAEFNITEKRSKILVVYSAKDSNKFNESIVDNKVHLNKDHLIEALGEKLANDFLKNKIGFSYKCDISSDLLYQLPESANDASSSDDDMIDFYKRTGKFIEVKGASK